MLWLSFAVCLAIEISGAKPVPDPCAIIAGGYQAFGTRQNSYGETPQIIGPKESTERQAGFDSTTRTGPLVRLIVDNIISGGDPEEYLLYDPTGPMLLIIPSQLPHNG